MPQYRITDPTSGRSITLTGDSAPTEAELTDIFGKINAQPAASSAPAQPEGSAAGRFLSNAGEMLNPISMLKGIGQAVAHPIDTASALVGAQVAQGRQAADLAGQGRYLEAAGHGLAAALPVLGPVAAQAGEQIGEGDIAGGLGKGTGLIAGLAIPGAVAKVKSARLPGLTTPAAAEAIALAERAGVPLDAATATGNRAVRAIQHVSDRSLGGSFVAEKAAQAQAKGLATLGEQLAAKANRATTAAAEPGANLIDKLPGRVRSAITDYISSGQPARAAEVAETVASEPGARAAITSAVRDQFGKEITVYRAGEVVPGRPQSWSTEPFTADAFGDPATTGAARPVVAGVVKAEDVLFPGAAKDGELVIDSSKVKPVEAGGPTVTPELAGQSVRDAVTGQIRRHAGAATDAYDALRAIESMPEHARRVPVRPLEGSAAAEGVPASYEGRFAKPHASVEELWQGALGDARRNGFTGSADELKAEFMDRLRSGREGLAESKAGAAEVDADALLRDIRRLGGVSDKGGVWSDLNELDPRFRSTIKRNKGGLGLDDLADQLRQDPKWQPIVEDANWLQNFLDRAQRGIKGKQVAGANELERALQVSGVEPGSQWWSAKGSDELVPLPVDLRNVKANLRPMYDELKRQAELTPAALMGDKARALQALDKIVGGPDHAPLSVVDAALGDLKSFARSDVPELRTIGQGKAIGAIKQLEAAVNQTAEGAGPLAVEALKAGRASTVAKYGAVDALKDFGSSGEPVAVYRQLTAPKDAAIAQLRDVAKQAPAELPKIGRAFLDDLLGEATAEGGFGKAGTIATKWQKLGPQTKRLLYKDPGYIRDLDSFFHLAKLTAENSNPSGTAHTLLVAGQGGLMLTNPVTGVASALGTAALSRLLRSSAGVRLLTKGLRVPLGNRAAAGAVAAEIAGFSEATNPSGSRTQDPVLAR